MSAVRSPEYYARLEQPGRDPAQVQGPESRVEAELLVESLPLVARHLPGEPLGPYQAAAAAVVRARAEEALRRAAARQQGEVAAGGGGGA